jgi:hypothetical protein
MLKLDRNIKCVMLDGFKQLKEAFEDTKGVIRIRKSENRQPVFNEVCATRSLDLCVCFVDLCLSLFFFVIGLSVLRFTNSDYPFGTFKRFF